MVQPENSNEASGPDSAQELPALDACFLVKFDVRKGYTITWKRSLPNVQLDGAVEFKSLPSGLHNVREDLIYFRHEQYVGLSAFINEPADEEARNALMLAVGILVRVGDGRMGKSWTYAEILQGLAKDLAADPENTSILEKFWENRRRHEDDSTSVGSPDGVPGKVFDIPNTPRPEGYKRSRGISNAAALLSRKHSLSGSHPATSLPDFLQSFGPLVFPLYRAALLRKRVLIVGDAPVQNNCNYVYDLSVLTSVPQNALPHLPYDSLPSLRLKPLFNVGVYDIPSLSPPPPDRLTASEFPPCWVACTTDDVLSSKPQLFDILVRLPPTYAVNAPSKVHPKIYRSHPSLATFNPRHLEIKATRRDARRFKTLRYNLMTPPFVEQSDAVSTSELDEVSENASIAESSLSTSSIIEGVSWSLIAYTSLVWWASAGEKRSSPSEEEDAEMQQDQDLLMIDLPRSNGSAMDMEIDQTHETSKELAIVAYFQRLTGLIIGVLSHAIERQEQQDLSNGQRPLTSYTDEDEAEENGGESDQQPLAPPSRDDRYGGNEVEIDDPVEITSEDMTQMGLDNWSAADRAFVEEMLEVWWGRKAVVRGGRVDCCGLRIL